MLLAFDTATPYVSVALHDGVDVVAERLSRVPMKHGEQLAPEIAEVLDAAGIVRQDVTAIAVGVGPGPFTGLRVGLVTARTLGFVLDIPVYGVCSLDVMAVEAVDTGQVPGDFAVATDARRKEVYLAAYDGAAARLDGPVVVGPAAAREALTERGLGGLLDRPVVGAGARLYPDAFARSVGPWGPSAGWLARVVAEERAELVDPEPMYLRRPDALAPGRPKRVS